MRSIQTLSTAMLFAGFVAWAWISGSTEPILTLIAVCIHEAGHMLGSLFCRVPLGGFRLTTFEARIRLAEESISYEKEAFISFMGPCSNLLSTGIATLLGGRLLQNGPLSFFATVSAALALLNLFPVSDFDGGRILYCAASVISPDFAARLCRTLSFFSPFLLWCVSVYILLRTGGNFSLFFFSISLFLRIFINEIPR